jgi:hypothetical protein
MEMICIFVLFMFLMFSKLNSHLIIENLALRQQLTHHETFHKTTKDPYKGSNILGISILLMERLARCIDCCKTRDSNPLA